PYGRRLSQRSAAGQNRPYRRRLFRRRGRRWKRGSDEGQEQPHQPGHHHPINKAIMNGLQFIHSLRQMPNYRGVPIVFLTTESDDALKQQAKAAGATGWITKPFKQDQLVSIMKKLLG